MANFSYWEQDTFLKTRDVIVLGSGIVGLSAAIHLKLLNPALPVSIVDEAPFPTGASTKNAGFACIGSPSELIDDLETRSESEVFKLVALRWEGLKKLRSLIADEQLGYLPTGGFEVFTHDETELYAQCINKLPALNEALQPITGLKKSFEVGYTLHHTLGFKNLQPLIKCHAEGTIHPGKMMNALRKKALSLQVEFLTGVSVTKINSSGTNIELETNLEHSLTCKKLLICTNGFTNKILDQIPVTPARNQVFVTGKIPGLKLSGCFHRYKGYYYFRNIDDRILIGGARHLHQEREQTSEPGTTADIEAHLTDFLSMHIVPEWNRQFEYKWSGTLGIGISKEPIVEKHQQGLYLAVRMGGMGVAIGAEIGSRAASMLLEE